jgi:alpha-soluble NSF attachment protein
MKLMYREAACRTHGNEQNDAMNAFHNAAKSYKKTNPEGQLSIPCTWV